MKSLAVSIRNQNENVTSIETINSVYKAGFRKVFIEWYDEDWNFSQEDQFLFCKKLGLEVIFAHLGYQNINSIWKDGSEGESLVQRYQDDIKKCSSLGITMVVMHLTRRMDAPMYNETGLNRLRKITKYAKTLGIKVAFENTKIKGYLEYVLDNIKDDNVGVCFDAGHCHVHFDDDFNFELFKDRIFAIHFHDNDKSGDLHLLPYDGTIDWNFFIDKLNYCNYNGPVTLEVCYMKDYTRISVDEFYEKAYDRGLKLVKIFN